jgi:hypothetical protein
MDEIRAGEELDTLRVQSVPWMDEQERVEALASMYRRSGMGDRAAADVADGMERISMDEFRADIGAGPERGRRG